jgi:hypothetical protein
MNLQAQYSSVHNVAGELEYTVQLEVENRAQKLLIEVELVHECLQCESFCTFLL